MASQTRTPNHRRKKSEEARELLEEVEMNQGKGKAFEFTPFKLYGWPTVVIAMLDGELLLQPDHVRITEHAAATRDGAVAYVAFRDEPRPSTAWDTAFYPLSWLRTLPEAKKCDTVERLLRAALVEPCLGGAVPLLVPYDDIRFLKTYVRKPLNVR